MGDRFQRRERGRIGLLLRGVGAARREGDLDVVAGILRRLFNRRRTAQHDQVGQRDGLAEALLDLRQLGQDRRQLRRLIDLPILLRAEANARAIGAAALVRAAEG
jgi:hypothetical protein